MSVVEFAAPKPCRPVAARPACLRAKPSNPLLISLVIFHLRQESPAIPRGSRHSDGGGDKGLWEQGAPQTFYPTIDFVDNFGDIAEPGDKRPAPSRLSPERSRHISAPASPKTPPLPRPCARQPRLAAHKTSATTTDFIGLSQERCQLADKNHPLCRQRLQTTNPACLQTSMAAIDFVIIFTMSAKSLWTNFSGPPKIWWPIFRATNGAAAKDVVDLFMVFYDFGEPVKNGRPKSSGTLKIGHQTTKCEPATFPAGAGISGRLGIFCDPAVWRPLDDGGQAASVC